MLQLYLYSFIAGLFGANGIPHFIRGIFGKKFQTPFGKESSAVVNVIWGWINFLIAGLLIYFGNVHAHILRAFGLTAIGALLMACLLAYMWSKNSSKK